MADITITINQPVLVGVQKFKVRYRLLPAGVFGAYVDRTNAPFTLTGLTAGQYEIEYIVVLEDGSECPTITGTFEIVEFECLTFTITQEASPYRLKIEFTVPGGYTHPVCGWNIGYQDVSGGVGVGGFANTNFPTLPASPIYINIPGALRDLNVRITANHCDTAEICQESIIPAPATPPCVPMSGFEYSLTKAVRTDTSVMYFLTLTATQSNPVSNIVNITVNQASVPPGAIQWTGSFISSPASNPFNWTGQIFHNRGITQQQITFNVWVRDRCGITHVIPITTTDFG